MALKYRLTQKQFDDLDESVQALYSEDGDGFVLDVDGAVDKKKLSEFRTSNRTLNTKLKELEEKYGDIDLDEVQELLSKKQEMEEGKLIAAGEVETVIEQRVKKALAPLKEQNEALQTQVGEGKEHLNRLLIDQRVTRIASKMGAHPTAIDDICNRARRSFKIQEGEAIAVDDDGDPRLNGKGEHFTMDDWMGELKTKVAPHCFQGVKGGNEQGNEQGNKPLSDMSSHDKIKAGVEKAQKR
jgi:hypothetical protein